MNPLLDWKAARFDQLPSCLGVGLMPEANALLLNVDRRTDIFATPFGAEPPDLVQHFDRTIEVDFAQEMNPASTQWHAPDWNQAAQGSGEPPQPRATVHLSGGLAFECGRVVMVHIPAPEEWTLRFDLLAIGELVPRPKGADPQRVEAFDLKVALGFVIGREERLDPTEQTQTHDLTQHVRMGVPATERAFVVELVQIGQPQFGPGCQQMQATCAAGLVQMLRQADSVREMVDGVKVLDFRSTAHMLGNDMSVTTFRGKLPPHQNGRNNGLQNSGLSGMIR